MTTPYRHPWAGADVSVLPGARWKEHRLFRGLTSTQLRKIAPHFDRQSLSAHEPLDLYGQIGVILTGALREDARGSSSGASILGVKFAGDLLCPGGDRVPETRISTLMDTEVMTCALEDIGWLMTEVPGLSTNVIRETQACVARSVDWFHLRGRQTAVERIAGLIAIFSERQGQPETVSLLLSRQDLGQLTALSFETVSRTIKALERDGIIDLPSPSRVVVRDHARLLHLTGTGALVPRAA